MAIKKKYHPPASNNFLPKNDGIDHINIFSRARTPLGKLLSNFAETPFTFEGIYYPCLESCLFYFRTGNKRIMKLSGKDAKKLGKTIPAKRFETPELLKKWIYAKLFSNPEIIDLLLKNRLPFSHYYVMYGRKIIADESHRIADIYRDITDELRLIKKVHH